MKIFLVDDHQMLREGLRGILSQQPGITIVGEASTGADALKKIPEAAPDLVVLDIHLPDCTGIELTRQILGILPVVKIVMFSSDASRNLVDEALQAGASGYVWKRSASEEMIRAVEIVMAGRLYLSPEVNAGILEDYRKNLIEGTASSKPLLSDRDRLLLRLISNGQRNKEIAEQLGVTPKSVEAFRSRLMKKLGCTSSAEMVCYAVREGIATV